MKKFTKTDFIKIINQNYCRASEDRDSFKSGPQ